VRKLEDLLHPLVVSELVGGQESLLKLGARVLRQLHLHKVRLLIDGGLRQTKQHLIATHVLIIDTSQVNCHSSTASQAARLLSQMVERQRCGPVEE
jgi:hypothetical protein